MISIWIFIGVSVGCAAIGMLAGAFLVDRVLRHKVYFLGTQRDEFARRLNLILTKDKPTTNGTLTWVFKVAKGEVR